LPPVEVQLQILAEAHGDARACIDAIETWLSAAPHAKAGGEIAVDWSRHPCTTVDE
jgi:hypothetical protein